jgi:hypothetical protein
MFMWITWMWIGIDFDLAVGLCSTGASRSDREMMLCLGNLYLQINSLSYSVFKFCVRSRKMRSRRIALSFWNKILTIKNCRKCKTKIKKSFTKILTIILSVKIVLTLRVKLPCPKCKILILREIFVLSFIVSEKNVKLFLILVLHLRQFFIVRIFVKRATGMSQQTTMSKIFLSECDVYFNTTQL